MASQKLVRCEIRRNGAERDEQVRYVPLEIYGLWEYLMTRRHGFEVGAVRDDKAGGNRPGARAYR